MKTTRVEFGYASVKDVTLPEGGGLTDQTESFWGGTSIISPPFPTFLPGTLSGYSLQDPFFSLRVV